MAEVTFYKKFSECEAVGKKWEFTHADLKDKKLVILSMTPVTTRYGECLLGKCLIDDKETSVLFGGEVLIRQLKLIENELPVEATIRKNGRYYEFE